MIERVKAKAAIVIGGIMVMAGMAAGQGYQLEWELDSLSAYPRLPSYVPTEGQNATPATWPQIFAYNTGNEFDLEDDGIPEILISEDSAGQYLKDIKIYDGATHALKYTVNYNFPGKTFRSTGNLYCGFFDVDNDGTKELVNINSSNGYLSDILFINVQSNAIEFEIDSILMGVCGIYDLDNDGHPEVWCVKGNNPYTLQIWGSGPSAVHKIAQPLAKANLAKLIGNAPNPFISTTKIEYYIPARQNVLLQVFNAEGRVIRALVNGPQKMGEYSLLWDGTADGGQSLAPGAYYYQLKIGDFVSSKKMIFLR